MNKRKEDVPPGHVRIVGGRLHGSRLTVPALPGLRPTPQRLRQTVFDWLAPVIEGARVLDIFAGTGALGIEALSRGARAAVFFEQDRAQALAIESDLARLHQHAGSVRHVDALRALEAPAPENFDIAFIDPPYEQADEYAEAMLALSGTECGLVIAQHASRMSLEESYEQLVKTRVLKQGDNSLSFYERIQDSTF